LRALAVSMPVAAAVATLTVSPSVVGELDWRLLIAGPGLAVLMPVIPFSLELLALRRLTASAFGTLMSLEPAIALIIGFAVLGQAPRTGGVAGILLVVAAGIGAERTGARRPQSGPTAVTSTTAAPASSEAARSTVAVMPQSWSPSGSSNT
jgi:inner membrane transporter RhtA